MFAELNAAMQQVVEDAFEQSRIDTLSKQFPKRMEIVWDEEKQVVRIGKCVVNKYTNFKDMKAFISVVFVENDIDSISYHPKWRMKAAATVFGCGPRAFYNYFNKLQYKVFVVPHIEALTKISYIPGRISSNALEKIRQNADVVNQVMEDKLYNLLPIVAVTGMSPQQLKKEFGPAWKVLSKNSLNKNRAIVKSRSKEKWVNKFEISADEIKERAGLPTTVLQNFAGCRTEVMQHIAKHYKGKWSWENVGTITTAMPIQQLGIGNLTVQWSDILYIVADTKRLADLVEQPFDPLWTPRKMKEKHDEYVKLNNALKYSPKPIEWVVSLPQQIEHEGYVATLLDSRALIAEEGLAMGHCVAGYAESVAQGSYLVYSITKGGQRSSTLGIDVRTKGDVSAFRMSQHYGKFNRHLVEQTEIDLGNLVIVELNKENFERKSK